MGGKKHQTKVSSKQGRAQAGRKYRRQVNEQLRAEATSKKPSRRQRGGKTR